MIKTMGCKLALNGLFLISKYLVLSAKPGFIPPTINVVLGIRRILNTPKLTPTIIFV